MKLSFYRTTWLFLFIAIMLIGLTACETTLPTPEPDPLLETLPAESLAAPPTATPTTTPTATQTPIPDIPIVITHTPILQDPSGTRLLWQWETGLGVANAVAVGGRLALLTDDGRFAWVTGGTGQMEVSRFVWSGVLEGDSAGELASDGRFALLAAHLISRRSDGQPITRSVMQVYDFSANLVWELPELAGQRFYTVAMGSNVAYVGQYPATTQRNQLTGHDIITGEVLWTTQAQLRQPPVTDPTATPTPWQTQTPPPIFGYRHLIANNDRVISLVESNQGSGAASFDGVSGTQYWLWLDPTDRDYEQITTDGERVYLLASDRVLALDYLTGELVWSAPTQSAPEAGLSHHADVLHFAPAPIAEFNFRPGIFGLDDATGNQVWHTLNGLLAQPLISAPDLLWVLLIDYDSGETHLSAINPETGGEWGRFLTGLDANGIYRLVAEERRVYILGDTLQAYGY